MQRMKVEFWRLAFCLIVTTRYPALGFDPPFQHVSEFHYAKPCETALPDSGD